MAKSTAAQSYVSNLSLLFFNIILMLLGIAGLLIGVLVSVSSEKDTLQDLGIGVGNLSLSSYLLIVSACLIIFTGVVGCIAIYRSSKILFPLYFVLAVATVVLAAVVSGISWSGVSSDELVENLGREVDETYNSYALFEELQLKENELKELNVLENAVNTFKDIFRSKRSLKKKAKDSKTSLVSGLFQKLKNPKFLSSFKNRFQKLKLKFSSSRLAGLKTNMLSKKQVKSTDKKTSFFKRMKTKTSRLSLLSMNALLPVMFGVNHELNLGLSQLQLEERAEQYLTEFSLVDQLQEQFECCGTASSAYRNETSSTLSVEQICPSKSYKTVCEQATEEYVTGKSSMLGITAIVFLLFQVIGIALAVLHLCTSDKKHQFTHVRTENTYTDEPTYEKPPHEENYRLYENY